MWIDGWLRLLWASCGHGAEIALVHRIMKRLLTQKMVHAIAPTGKKQRFPDHKVIGLELRVAPRGTKAWAIRYRSQTGASKEMKIGTADKMPLEQARQKAREELANVPNGDDPLQQRRKAKQEAVIAEASTLAAVVELYRKSSAYVTKRQTTRDTYDNSLNRHLIPRIGQRPIKSISKGEIAGLLDSLLTEHSGGVSNQARSALSVVMAFAVERDIVDFNPVLNVKPKHKTRVRERLLSDTEIRGLWAAMEQCEGMSPTIANLLRVCLLLPARVNEIAGMQWRELDLKEGLWRVSADRMKGKEAHELPLGRDAIALLTMLQSTAVTAWVFPNKKGDAPMSRQRPSRACNRLSKRMGWKSFGPHDLRRTIATRLAKLGMGSATIERTLGHKVGTGRAIVHYDHHDYRDRKKLAIEAWEAELRRVVTGANKANNVHELHRAKAI